MIVEQVPEGAPQKSPEILDTSGLFSWLHLIFIIHLNSNE
jgi:hypothetical protein